MHGKKRRVCGVGINDADYITQTFESSIVNGKCRNKVIWRCPFYDRWVGMLSRCYGGRVRDYYKNCSVCDEWLLFSNFRRWMVEQDWQGKHLDKDILVKGNKEYHPDKCSFVPKEINSLFTSVKKVRGEYPIGVTMRSDCNVFVSRLSISSKNVCLGHYDNVQDAFLCYKYWKEAHIKSVAHVYRGSITKQVYEALMGWEIEHTD